MRTNSLQPSSRTPRKRTTTDRRPQSIDKQEALQFRESEELLRLAQDAGHIGIFEYDRQSGVARLSPQLLSMYGLTEFDGSYEAWLKCVFREDRLRITNEVETAINSQLREWQTEFRVSHLNWSDPKWFEARNLIIYDADGRAVRIVGVNVDVSERKRAMVQLNAFTETLAEAVKERTRELEQQNAARIKAEELLRQSQKMEAVGQLTGGVAHDFNNLLTIVMGGLDMIGRQIPVLAPPAAAERVVRARDMALHGVQRAVTLTNRLLAFSRQQPLDPKSIDANKLIGPICEFLRRSLGEQISLEFVLAVGLWRTCADSNQLENALLNLTLNARDAMPNGGKVTIETANCYLDESYVHSLPEPVAVGQYVMIAVADTGSGMDESTAQRVFEPFFTTKAVGKGTGLGLSQVYGFVRQSSGHVSLYSELGEGTTVKIYLPRFIGAEDQVDDDQRATNQPNGTETVLVVEDDEELRTYAVESLTELGYCVLSASNAKAALEVLKREDLVHLLFTDVVMPGGVNGRQLADEAVRIRPALKVLFTTGYTRNAIVHHGRLDAGVELLSKPYSFDDLSAKVRTVLDK